MTNAHHKYIVKVVLKYEFNGVMSEHTHTRQCNNEKTKDQTLKRWEKELKNGTFFVDSTPFTVVKEPWVELR